MKKPQTFLIIIFLFISSQKIFPQVTEILGTVKDAETGEALIGTNVFLKNTAFGAATDFDGKYIIKYVPVGNYKVVASFIGYKPTSKDIKLESGKKLEINFELKLESLKGEEVVVTAQALGQKQAINQQLSDDKIVSIVSAAKIQELPYANAAESVGRLPGVSVLRSGGEGSQVVIRGLAPKYNQVKISGVQMSSSNSESRSSDLSMVSSNMLEGIEVAKTITSDMDANVIGGVVNFELREAHSEVPKYGLLIQGGYNDLSDAQNKFNNYKYVVNVESRFFENRFGVFAQIDVGRRNLTSNELGATYDHKGNSKEEYITNELNLKYIGRDRQRYNGALVLDYRLPEGKIKFANFISSGNTKVQDRTEKFNILGNQHFYEISGQSTELNIISNVLSLKQNLSLFDIDLTLSHSYSEQKDPNNWTASFIQTSAGLNQFNNKANINPVEIPKAANDNFDNTFLGNFNNGDSFSKERTLGIKLDALTNLNLSKKINAALKFGGAYSYKTKNYDKNYFDGQGLSYASAKYVDNLIIQHLGLPTNLGTTIPISYFADPNFNYGEFLGGEYAMVMPLQFGQFASVSDLLRENEKKILNDGGAIAYGRNNFRSTTNDYSGNENLSALYLMATFNFGKKLTFISGVRYQNLQTSYTGTRGIQSPLSYYKYNHYDTTVTKNHGYLLPSIVLRYKPLTWFDVRLSYTNTLAYPDYSAIIPRIDVSTSSIEWNDFNLVPSRSINYDVYFSFYNNTIGLFTIGGFLKQIHDLIYAWQFYASNNDALDYYPPSLIVSSNLRGTYQINTSINNSFLITDWGIELDWQTHFWYLPGVLSGLVLDVNYTHVFSEATYPYTIVKSTGRSVSYIDTSFTDRLLYQPNDIANLSLGYDYKDFSFRLSLLYQADIFTGPNFWVQLRSNTAAYTRWDLSFKQTLPWFGIQLFGNLNNINGANDISIIQGGAVPRSQQDYGMTADLGIRLKL